MSDTPPATVVNNYYITRSRPASNGWAIASLVLGLVTLAVGWFPVIGILFGLIPGLLAVIFGIVGHNVGRKRGGLGIQMANWGTLLGLSPIIFTIVWAVVRNAS